MAAITLSITIVGTLAHRLMEFDFGLPLAGIGLALYLLACWQELPLNGKALTIAAYLGFAVLLGSDKSLMAELQDPLARAGYFALFLGALALLREVATQSPMIERCGQVLIDQPPPRRYLTLTFGSLVMTFLLNMGAITLLGTMVMRGSGTPKDPLGREVAVIRRKRMTLALLRAFCTTPLWSPTSIIMAVMLTAFTDLSWDRLASIGISATVAALAAGFILDRVTRPKHLSHLLPKTPQPFDITPFLPLTLLIAVLTLGAYGLNALTQWGFVLCLILWVPVIAVTWAVIQSGVEQTPETIKTLIRKTPAISLEASHEIAVIACAVFLGSLIASSIDMTATSAFLENLPVSPAILLIAVSWIIVGLSFTGIGPMITVIIAVGVLKDLPLLAGHQEALALSLAGTWAIILGFAPLIAPVRLAARAIETSPHTVGISWNGFFSFLALLALNGALLVTL